MKLFAKRNRQNILDWLLKDHLYLQSNLSLEVYIMYSV